MIEKSKTKTLVLEIETSKPDEFRKELRENLLKMVKNQCLFEPNKPLSEQYAVLKLIIALLY